MTGVDVTFACVQNAGPSQMATAFAEREREERGLEDRTPREVTTETLTGCDYVATMDCSTLDLDADGHEG